MAVSALRSSAAASSARLGARHAHAAADEHLLPLERHGLHQRVHGALGDDHDVGRRVRVGHEDRELVAAQAGHRVAPARGVEQALGHHLQQPVARRRGRASR
jgi:hypothetical protein